MSNQTKIKSFTLTACPHCGKELYVLQESLPTEVKKLYQPKELALIKESFKARIIKLAEEGDKKLKKEERDKLIEYINLETSLFDEEDVEETLKGIIDGTKN